MGSIHIRLKRDQNRVKRFNILLMGQTIQNAMRTHIVINPLQLEEFIIKVVKVSIRPMHSIGLIQSASTIPLIFGDRGGKKS